MKTILKPVLIYLPLDLIEQVDQVSAASAISRSEQIRASLKRDIDYIVQRQSVQDASHARLIEHDYRAWRRGNEETQL